MIASLERGTIDLNKATVTGSELLAADVYAFALSMWVLLYYVENQDKVLFYFMDSNANYKQNRKFPTIDTRSYGKLENLLK